MYVVGNADITGRVSDYMSLAAWFKLVETDDTDELEAFSVVDTLMVSISLILAFIQDQRKQQGVNEAASKRTIEKLNTILGLHIFFF